jgi:signal transduction histidine kinase
MEFLAGDLHADEVVDAASVDTGAHRHLVQFYEDDEYLCAAVADFLGAGMARGQAGLVIATPPHRERTLEALAGRGVDTETLLASGELTMLDARGFLDTLMVDGRPDADAFRDQVGKVVASCERGSKGAGVRAYGEMVDLLAKDGDLEATIRVEELWNDLAAEHSFTLLCGYRIGHFSRAVDAAHFRDICDRHHHVIPTERYAAADGEGRLREISALQQRAVALETELEARRDLERQLRAALVEQEGLLLRERAARTEAEQASRSKRDFLAVMSHELRTPLNAIAGYAELLELGVHGPITARQRESLERIQRSQERLLGLVDEVLMYSRSESGKVRYQSLDFPVADVLRAIDARVLQQMREKEIDYACAACDQDVRVHADPDKVHRILLNLLGNAVKFTPPGGRIRVRCDAGDGEVRVLVSDSGIGIPAEMLEAIFQPFMQVDARLTREHGGAGLGLAISREFARGMDGDLVAAANPGGGTTFTLTLPRSSA